MATLQKISPCLWFDSEAEEAANFYVSVFDNSRIVRIARYGHAGHAIHKRPAGSVMTVSFELDGLAFTALNGGPVFTFNEAVSLIVYCETQAEIDRIWSALSEAGDPSAQMCGWLKDRYGVSWQVVPANLAAMTADPDTAKTDRLMEALLGMKKLDMLELERAYAG